jgi:hypothetical protein
MAVPTQITMNTSATPMCPRFNESAWSTCFHTTGLPAVCFDTLAAARNCQIQASPKRHIPGNDYRIVAGPRKELAVTSGRYESKPSLRNVDIRVTAPESRSHRWPTVPVQVAPAAGSALRCMLWRVASAARAQPAVTVGPTAGSGAPSSSAAARSRPAILVGPAAGGSVRSELDRAQLPMA